VRLVPARSRTGAAYEQRPDPHGGEPADHDRNRGDPIDQWNLHGLRSGNAAVRFPPGLGDGDDPPQVAPTRLHLWDGFGERFRAKCCNRIAGKARRIEELVVWRDHQRGGAGHCNAYDAILSHQFLRFEFAMEDELPFLILLDENDGVVAITGHVERAIRTKRRKFAPARPVTSVPLLSATPFCSVDASVILASATLRLKIKSRLLPWMVLPASSVSSFRNDPTKVTRPLLGSRAKTLTSLLN
jgi:hypothetical protein